MSSTDRASSNALDAAASAEVPGTFVHDDVRYEEWLRELENPGLTLDGSHRER
jgi:hypothetical protein